MLKPFLTFAALLAICTITLANGNISLLPSDDGYIRGGTYSSDNFNSSSQLSLKNSGNDDYDRLIYLKFDLKGINEVVNSGKLQITTKSFGNDFFGSTAVVKLVEDDSWLESTINWQNAPAGSLTEIRVNCSEGINEWDVSELLTTGLQMDSVVSLLISFPEGLSEDSWAHFHSKETTTQNYEPQLIINENTKATAIHESNRIDWSKAGVEGGIPNYATIIDVTTIGADDNGTIDNSTVIQNTIDNASAGTVLFFPAGTYLFNSSLKMKDSIIIRGECVAQTVLNFDLQQVAAPSIHWESTAVGGSSTSITAGFDKGSSVLTVSNASLFTIGDYVDISQDNDANLMYTNNAWDVSWSENSVGQMVRIENIVGSQIYLNEPLMYNFSASLNVKALPAKMITGAGVENLKIHRVDDGNDYNLRFDYAANCWIRNIEGDHCDRGHIVLNESAHIEIRESYFHHAYDYGGGGHGYGVNVQDHTTACLFENNIFYYLRHTYLAKEGAIGNVFSYNYSHSPNGSANDIALHGHYGLMNLLEGNVVQKIIAGDWWGPSGPGNTYYRNRVESSDIIMQDATHKQNIVGNEIENGDVDIIDSDNTWQSDNQNNSGTIDFNFSGDLDASLYLQSKPAFLTGFSFPAFGPEYVVGQNSIPAKERWENNLLDLVPCLNPNLITNNSEVDIVDELFPNPFRNQFYYYNHTASTELFIVDISGRTVHHQALSIGENTISTSKLVNGIYFVHVSGVVNSYKVLKK